jgi:hypothetical protein
MDPDGIDYMAADPRTGSIILAMVQTEPFTGSPEEAAAVLEKLRGYLEFVESGELEQSTPQARGRPVQFHLDYYEPLPASLEGLFERASARLATKGIGFSSILLEG